MCPALWRLAGCPLVGGGGGGGGLSLRLWSLEFWTAYCQPVKIFWKLDTPVTPNSKTDNKEGIGDRWIPTRSGFPNVDGVSLSNAYAGRLQVVWEWRGRSDVGTWGREPGRLGFVEIA
ncbi:uncharacterized protein BDZ83DRAFT_656093 [Colletotrichum acutatum]|uniref:Uncharacterized protein n=1 Tax=Glomerella acutata TaxID=27357 RepID=A0AAD8UDQ9_GLOAC|nr:uncharacterized protein BDZ83DRAFT_656093 [Colletotrichum acutatum]KAK1714124.1 hypothetical protein BDZ83DRAFT_656093 [Colletotrichum acutatum]